MRLRKLNTKDAPFMLEWMHDESVVEDLQGNFREKTLEDCQAFIVAAEDASANLHMAVTDETDTYMGTVSLKHIEDGSAEFAITIRSCAMGKGYSAYAMEQILGLGFEQLGLNAIYWCVSGENKRAVRFYDKHGYPRMDPSESYPGMKSYTPEQIRNYLWYCIKK